MSKRGKANANYRNGKYCENHHCIDCGTLIDTQGRSVRCKVCAGTLLILDQQKFTELVVKSKSYAEIALKLVVSRQTVTRRIKEFEIDITHFRPARSRRTDKSIILSKGTVRRNGTVKSLILRDKLIEYQCSGCQLRDLWQTKPLVLELDHINGDPTDNRLENLRFLCPNCHSQTNTSKGKNIIKKKHD